MDLAALTDMLTDFGGLGAVAVFCWMLLRSTLARNKELTDIISNHLATDLQQQQLHVQILTDLRNEIRDHVHR